MRNALQTLFHPFETGHLDLPSGGQRVLFLAAEPGLRLPEGFDARLNCVQGLRPFHEALRAEGHAVSPVAAEDGYDFVLVLPGRHRGLNELHLAQALRRAAPGATVVVAGGKEDGIASLRRRLEALVPLAGNLSKYHAVAFWLARPADPADAVAALEAGNGSVTVNGRYETRPGMFSHDRVDPGSALLAQHLPATLSGAVADFGAGWGYLSDRLAANAPGIASIDLYETDHAALQAALANMARLHPGLAVSGHWADLTAEQPPRRFDAIVMNPPFHAGRAAEPSLGLAFIAAASKALKPGGRLFMVANRGLPYEPALERGFARMTEIVRDGSYKVLEARR